MILSHNVSIPILFDLPSELEAQRLKIELKTGLQSTFY